MPNYNSPGAPHSVKFAWLLAAMLASLAGCHHAPLMVPAGAAAGRAVRAEAGRVRVSVELQRASPQRIVAHLVVDNDSRATIRVLPSRFRLAPVNGRGAYRNVSARTQSNWQFGWGSELVLLPGQPGMAQVTFEFEPTPAQPEPAAMVLELVGFEFAATREPITFEELRFSP